MTYKIIVKKEEEQTRVDFLISEHLEDVSRTQVKNLFKENLIKVNDKNVKPSYKVKENDLIFITLKEEENVLEPLNLNIEIVYEDDYIIVLNKPAGLVVHPGVSVKEVTLVNHLLFYTDKLSNINEDFRPGIVHRLDKDTSGLIVVAKTNEAHHGLVSQFQERTVKRTYLAVCHSPFNEDSGTIKLPIKRDKVKMVVDQAGKEAITHFKVLNQNKDYSYLKCNLITGRTHQIRVHLSYINHPIVADSTYGLNKRFKNYTQALHAYELEFIHPITKKLVNFKKELPIKFKEILKKVGLDNA